MKLTPKTTYYEIPITLSIASMILSIAAIYLHFDTSESEDIADPLPMLVGHGNETKAYTPSPIADLQRRVNTLERVPYNLALARKLPIGTFVQNVFGRGKIIAMNQVTGLVEIEGHFLSIEQERFVLNQQSEHPGNIIGFSWDDKDHYWMIPYEFKMYSSDGKSWRDMSEIDNEDWENWKR